MSRYARRRDPVVRRKQRVELTEGNIALRLLGVGAAILIAALAFGYVINNLLNVQTGWQIIEAANPETGIAEQFTLRYNIGASGQAATAELKGVSAVYTEALEHAYRVLSNLPMDPYVNLWTLNAHPNEAVTVDSLLYEALRTVEAQSSRIPYFAPLFEQYNSLFSCSTDESAEDFDPILSEAVGEYAAEISVFANDPAMVRIELLPEQQVRLVVSPEYKAYAGENGVESFVDFGILLNAFLCDAAADAMVERGYTNGILSGADGNYIRAMCAEELAIPIFDLVNGKTVELGTAVYHGPAALVSFRSFPMGGADDVNYYTYANGTVRAPFVGQDGLLHTAADRLLTGAGECVAELAIRTHAAYAKDSFDPAALGDVSWILTDGGQYEASGTLFAIR